MKAVIAGAGIGGLAAAVALHRRGVDVTVLERDEQPATTGLRVSSAPGAQHDVGVKQCHELADVATAGRDTLSRRPRTPPAARTAYGPGREASRGDCEQPAGWRGNGLLPAQ